jgi:hypothetical protein
MNICKECKQYNGKHLRNCKSCRKQESSSSFESSSYNSQLTEDNTFSQDSYSSPEPEVSNPFDSGGDSGGGSASSDW